MKNVKKSLFIGAIAGAFVAVVAYFVGVFCKAESVFRDFQKKVNSLF